MSPEPRSSRYADLSRAELAALVPELLLVGQLIDRSGMAWCIAELGREQMVEIAIEEWAGSSPIYTRRMQSALGFRGDDVTTIFKGLQLDIGAPPQFMDFRYTVHDARHGEFHLDHCGALLDVEPMGPEYVRSMCHDIEDPTFDATAVATNARAQVRPIHRPPRMPADRNPHCAWTVVIDDEHPEAQPTPTCLANERSHAAHLELAPIDPTDAGMADYAGPLVSDLDFGAFSHSALVRLADEVCVQMHLLNLAFRTALASRTPEGGEQALRIARKQLTGIAGIATERIRRAVDVSRDPAGAVRVLALHPLLNPAAYVDASVAGDRLTVRHSAAHEDGAWISLCGPDTIEPLQAAVRAVDPRLDVEVAGSASEWTLDVVERSAPLAESEEVAVTRFSSGVAFEFSPRRSIPITPV